GPGSPSGGPPPTRAGSRTGAAGPRPAARNQVATAVTTTPTARRGGPSPAPPAGQPPPGPAQPEHARPDQQGQPGVEGPAGGGRRRGRRRGRALRGRLGLWGGRGRRDAHAERERAAGDVAVAAGQAP